eukprot:scaffold14006_cov114-Isochrysis_galbana.AAC.3
MKCAGRPASRRARCQAGERIRSGATVGCSTIVDNSTSRSFACSGEQREALPPAPSRIRKLSSSFSISSASHRMAVESSAWSARRPAANALLSSCRRKSCRPPPLRSVAVKRSTAMVANAQEAALPMSCVHDARR